MTPHKDGLPAAAPALSEDELGRWLAAAAPGREPEPGTGPRPTCPAPLSFAQERLWFLDKLNPGRASYTVPLLLRIRGPLWLDGLRRALTEVVCRHDVLRARFLDDPGGPVQQVADAEDVAMPVVDLDGMPDTETELARQLRADVAEPFDLHTGPVLRARLWRLAGQQHALLVSVHHIVFDGWSADVLLRELGESYAAICQSRPAILPELELQYQDYARRQRAPLASKRRDRDLRYWRAQLDGAPHVLELPTDFPRPPVQGSGGDSVPLDVPAETIDRLSGLAQRHGATVFMTALAVTAALAHRYTGETDIVLGTTVANRGQLGTERLIGFFANTVAVRVDLSDDPTFAKLLDRVRESALGAYEHQELPFERVVDELAPARDLRRQPLVQVMVSVDNVPRGPLSFGDLDVEVANVPTETANFDLSLGIAEGPGGLAGALLFSTDLFERATIERFADQWGTLLADGVRHPETPVSRLRLLSPAEHRRLTSDRNLTGITVPDLCLPALLLRQTRRTPEATAVQCGGELVSFAELDWRSAALAARLAESGTGAETPVGVCLERSIDAVVALLAVLRAGAVYVPLTPDYPPDRLAFMYADSGMRLVITRPRWESILPAEAMLLPVSGREPRHPQAETGPPCHPDNLAYIIYTSGSTGRPKGVGVSYRNVLPILEWGRDNLFGGQPMRTLQSLSPSFDFGFFEVVSTLIAGGTVVIPSGGSAGLADYPALCAEYDIQSLCLTPSQLGEVVRLGAALPSIRVILLGGEQLHWQLVDAARKLLSPTCVIINGYGPTENSIGSVNYRIPVEHLGRSRSISVPIGLPSANNAAYVLDQWLRPVPLGVAGELFVSGGVARGYLNQPGLTAQRMLPHPFSTIPGSRLYRTGDLVRQQPDGTLVFLRRIDRQVKIRGFRVELAEIDEVLREHPAVADSVCIHRAELDQLMACVVPTVSAEVDLAELRRFAAVRLPHYMVPTRLLSVAELPRGPVGKVDNQALINLADAAGSQAHLKTRPLRPGTETTLAELWQKLLAREIGPDDDFFELGGTSFLAARLITAIERRFGVGIGVRAVFEATTLAGLATRLDQQLAADTSADDLDGYLAELETLSEDEAAALLATEGEDQP